MAEGGSLQILGDSLTKARIYANERNFGRSFAHYLVVFQLLSPDRRVQYENEFTSVLQFWGTTLHRRGQFDDIFRCYHLAMNYFPNSVEILNNLGLHTLKLKHYQAAKLYFQNCRIIDRNYLPAEQNLQTTKYALVERWHFSMLNDILRNKSYAQAIFMEINHGFTNILDIGTGTGILSLFASKSKQSKSIVACDYSESMYEIAKKVLEANNINSVRLLKKSSILLSVPEDFNRKATLLVTEILDSGVFGENILETVIHAWEYLLTPFPYGKVIPAGVCVYVTGIQCDELSRNFRLVPRENNILKINELCLIHGNDPYDTENIKSLNVSYMTETQMALFVNFNDVQQLKSLYESEFNHPTATLKCTKNGKIDTFAVWFTLQLNDTVTLSTDPNSPYKSCWDQALRHLRHPLPVEVGQEVTIHLSCYEGYLEIECPQSETITNHRENSLCHLVPKNTILFLNDILLMDYLAEISIMLSDRYKDMSKMTVLDLTPFPILGLLLLQRGALLTYCVKDPFVESAIREMCELNSIDVNRITFMAEREFSAYTVGDVSWDIVFHNVVSPCGILCEAEVYQAGVMKMSITHRGVYLPARVNVWAQLVQCEWLDQVTKVDDRNCCGFKIAQFINEYKSNEQRDINYFTIPHIDLTEPANVGFIQDEITVAYVRTTDIIASVTGQANAVFYWFEFTFFEDVSINTRRPEAFAATSAFMLESSVSVTEGEVVPLVLKQHKGLLKIYVGGTE